MFLTRRIVHVNGSGDRTCISSESVALVLMLDFCKSTTKRNAVYIDPLQTKVVITCPQAHDFVKCEGSTSTYSYLLLICTYLYVNMQIEEIKSSITCNCLEQIYLSTKYFPNQRYRASKQISVLCGRKKRNNCCQG